MCFGLLKIYKMKFIHELSTKAAHLKASTVDEHLARFLTEQGFKTTPWTIDTIKSELKERGFEVICEVNRYSESEVYTFKLCKVYCETSLTIPNPHVHIVGHAITDD